VGVKEAVGNWGFTGYNREPLFRLSFYKRKGFVMNYTDQDAHNSPEAYYGFDNSAAMATLSERTIFIRKTYAHVALAILGFVAIEFAIFSLVPAQTLNGMMRGLGGWGMLIFFGAFMLVSWVARSWAESDTSYSVQYMGLALYTAVQAVFFVPLLLYAQNYCGENSHVISTAAIITLIIFGGLTAFVHLTKADFSWLRMYLMLGGLASLAFIVGAMVFGINLGLFFSIAMVVLVSGYILYDTSNILHHYRTDQYVAAALALFASIVILFYYVLRILIALSGRD